jgi:DNA-binding Lrp family transcriptional regulator
MPIDRTDRAIIAELAVDSRLSIRTIAERVHISRTAAHHRVQNLIARGVLTGFGAQVDRKAIGLEVVAIVIIKVENVPWPELAASLAELPYVESVLAVSGDIDFVVTVSAPDHEHLSEVIMRQIHGMPGVASTRSHVVLDARDGSAPGTRLDDWPAADSRA